VYRPSYVELALWGRIIEEGEGERERVGNANCGSGERIYSLPDEVVSGSLKKDSTRFRRGQLRR